MSGDTDRGRLGSWRALGKIAYTQGRLGRNRDEQTFFPRAK